MEVSTGTHGLHGSLGTGFGERLRIILELVVSHTNARILDRDGSSLRRWESSASKCGSRLRTTPRHPATCTRPRSRRAGGKLGTATHGSTTALDTLGNEMVDNVSMMRSGLSSRIFEIKSIPIPVAQLEILEAVAALRLLPHHLWHRVDELCTLGAVSLRPIVARASILCYVSAKFFNILNATKLGKTELQEYEPRGTTAILRMSKESQRNSSGIFSQGSLRCSSVIKSIIC